MKNLFILLSFSVALFSSCEKEIIIDVEDAPQQVVIEGVLRNFVGESYILLSKSSTLYGSINFEKISGATVVVTDNFGNNYPFSEDTGIPGKYILPTFQTFPNTIYNLSVLAEGIEYTATSNTFTKPTLDSLFYIETSGGFGGGANTDTSYFLFYSFFDNALEENFYRIRPYVNDTADNNFYITNDDLGNGENIQAPFFGTDIKKGSMPTTVKVELISMDQANYRYLFSWSNASDGSPFAATPSNPVTNIKGSDNVVGYFGAFMIDTMSIILP